MKGADGPSGTLSERSGVNIETIRYYEKIGVMPSPARSAGGTHRQIAWEGRAWGWRPPL